jgi:hypothetical protein
MSSNNDIKFSEVEELLANNKEEEPKISLINENMNEEVIEEVIEEVKEEVKEKKVTIDESKNEVKEVEQKKTFEELLIDYLKTNEVKLLIATITNSNSVSIGYCQSMTQMATHFTKLDINYDIITIQNERINSRGKNCVIAKLLSDASYTHLLFIDTNITFTWKNICNLIMNDKEVSGGAYPQRNINYSKLAKVISDNEEISQSNLLAKSMDYHFNPKLYEEEVEVTEEEVKEGKPTKQQKINIDNNMIEVKTMDSGFMILKRQALEKMVDKLGIFLKFNNNYKEYGSEELNDHFYSFFERERTEQGYLTEDTVFCNRWIKCGGQLWIDLQVNLNANYTVENTGSLYLSVVEK